MLTFLKFFKDRKFERFTVTKQEPCTKSSDGEIMISSCFHKECGGVRVCLISSYPPNRARLSEYAKNLVNELSRRPGIESIHILADENKNSKDFQIENSKVQVSRIWKPDSFLSVSRILSHIIALKPDVVHFNVHFQSFGKNRLSNFAGLSLIFLCKFLGFKVLAEIHNLGEKVDLEKVRLKPSLLNKIGILVATKLILTAPKVVVTVRSYVGYLNRRYGHFGVQYIPHGTNAGSYPAIDPEEKIILLFGHMGPYKGVPNMIKAFQELRVEKHNVRLLIAGTSHPNFPNFLEEFAKKKVPFIDFLGYIPEEEVERIFRMSDVVVIPYSTTTGTSGVFHLACGYGKPIVASDLPEIRELVEDGASAILVPPNNVQALKDAILKVIFDEDLAARMREQNTVFARNESWSVVAQEYEEAYLELMNC